MAQALVRNLDDDTLDDYRAAAVRHGRSLEAELREGLQRARPRRDGDRRARAEAVRALLPDVIPGPDGTEIIRWYRDTTGAAGPMPLVVDASVAFKWFVPEAGRDEALAILDGEDTLWAPDLVLTENGNALGGKFRRLPNGLGIAQAALREMRGFHAHLMPSADYVDRALELSFAFGHPIYDCIYLAVCERHDLTMVTADERLMRVMEGAPEARWLRPLVA